MRKILLAFLFLAAYQGVSAQKVESIYFHLYTDSLKKGFYNYINVDGKLADGGWMPLDSSQILFTCNTGFFDGNDLFIDSAYQQDTVRVKAVLKRNPAVCKEITIYIRKRGFDEPLKTNEEVLQDIKRKKRRG